MYQLLTIAGRLGSDPEMRYTPAGQEVCNFSVATDRKYKNKDGETVSDTTWFRVAVWGAMAAACNKYLKKGSAVLVTGRLATEIKVYQTTSGEAKASYEVTAENVRFLNSGDGHTVTQTADIETF